jgi:predicted metal-dependent peptidase
MARRQARGVKPVDPHEQAFLLGWQMVSAHPMFRPLTGDPTGVGLYRVYPLWTEEASLSQARGWALVRADGRILANKHARGTADEWAWVLAHCALHVGFGHLDGQPRLDRPYAAACCLAVTRFQNALRLGSPPERVPVKFPNTPEEALARRWREIGVPPEYADLGVGGTAIDLYPQSAPRPTPRPAPRPGPHALSWPERLAIGLAAAATAAVEEAGAVRHVDPDRPAPDSPWEQARRWFVSSYPLLGALAAGFRIVADRELAQQWQISVAAVDASIAEIYVNPLARLTEPECRFVLAHEMLHAALRHGDRVAHRDPYLWNVATDYVINGWLVEMGVGVLPEDCLYDATLAGMSSEEVYDRIARDLRKLRKLATLRGRGRPDVLGGPLPGRDEARRGLDLDAYYRRALCSGLAYHESTGRGLLPSGLVDEIRVLDQPPLPWDAKLARWFDEYVPAPSKRRTYARPSRRQASTPGIPRPGWYLPEEREHQVTFGVVLDTSGSMDRLLLGKALGAIASYALARDVPAARVVFCDAAAYDAGYLPVEEIAGRVQVRGRGGTVLQPGVDLLERADDFPPDGPILVITDGWCDPVRIRREHAFLVPEGARLPFVPRGPVFRLR